VSKDEAVATTAGDTAVGATAPVAAAAVATKPSRPKRPPKVKKPRPPKSILGRLTVAVMLIVVSSMALVELADIAHFQLYEYAAAALGVVAVGLLVGAWIGRAYWLIIIALLIAPVLFFSSLLPRVTNWSAGDPSYLPTSVQEIPESYDLGAGRMTIDLTHLSVEQLSQAGEIDASLGLGQLVVRLPSDVGATVDAKVGAGSVSGGQVFDNAVVDVYEYSGLGVEQVFTVGSPPHDLLLSLEVGMGEIEIQYVGQLEAGIVEIEG
jgi:hypothetical protein